MTNINTLQFLIYKLISNFKYNNNRIELWAIQGGVRIVRNIQTIIVKYRICHKEKYCNSNNLSLWMRILTKLTNI